MVAVIVTSAKPAVFAALTQLAVVQRHCGRNGPAFGMGHFLDLGEFVGVDFALGPRALNSLDVLKSLVDLIDEFSAQFATDPPCQPTLAWAACREYDGELSRNIEIFGDYLRAAIRHVRDRAVARQRTGPELDLRDPSA